MLTTFFSWLDSFHPFFILSSFRHPNSQKTKSTPQALLFCWGGLMSIHGTDFTLSHHWE
jgi:hypothetical protein